MSTASGSIKPFPDPIVDGKSVVEFDGERVTMPFWYWKKITEYVIEVEEGR